jgi:hypothetical protein
MTKDEDQIIKATLSAFGPDEGVTFAQDTWAKLHQAISAVVAQPAPVHEPVATLWQHGETGRTRITMPGDITDCDARWFKASDLYTTPPAVPAPVQEPVAWANPNDLKNFDMKVRTNGGPLHTLPLCLCTPPAAKRQWVGLSDEEMQALWDRYAHMEMMRAIEAKLKELNI